MRDFSIAVDINATPDRVWTVMWDIERWPEWTPSVRGVERLDDGPLTVGSRARLRQPNVLPAVWRVTAVDQGRSFTWITHSPGVTARATHRIEPTTAGSRVTLSVHFSGLLGSLVGWLLQGLNNKYLRLEATGLKRRSETG